jgi:hypothetical protein
MDLGAVSALDELILGACLLLIPASLLALGAREGRRLLAAAPGVLSFILFSLAFAHLHLASGAASEPIPSVYFIGLAVALLLLVPSVLSLRNRWLGLVHIATVAGILWSFFIGAMLLARDSL